MATPEYYVGQIIPIYFRMGIDVSGASGLSLRVTKGDGSTKETWTMILDVTDDTRFQHTLTEDEGWDAHGTWEYQPVFTLGGNQQFGNIVTNRVDKVI